MNRCIICGCTDLAACNVDGEPCSWALALDDGPVCSACVLTPIAIIPPAVGQRLLPEPIVAIDNVVPCTLCGGDGCYDCGWRGAVLADLAA